MAESMSNNGEFVLRPVKPQSVSKEPRNIRNLYVSSVAYNLITLTDGALRSIVLLFLVQLGFSAIALAVMFSLYELMGVFMNFSGGLLGAKYGMRFLVLLSVIGQLGCVILLIPLEHIFPNVTNTLDRDTVAITIYIVIAQMLSGIAKDLMKIQGKSVPKLVTKAVGEDDKLFKIISILTGMKNSIKGFGYLFGSLLIWGTGWIPALAIQAGLLLPIIPMALVYMESDLGISRKAQEKARVTCAAFRKGYNVNVLSLARFFLFGSRDVWFEIAAPYFFRSVLGWAPFAVGGFMAGYTIIYGQLQALTSQLFAPNQCLKRNPNRRDVTVFAGLNAFEILILGIGSFFSFRVFADTGDSTAMTIVLLCGIVVFAALFAVSSAVHSFLIVQYSNRDKVAMDVGFYYMSNAGGRLVGTLISGFIYTYTVDEFGLAVCLWVAAGFLIISTIISAYLRDHVVVVSKNDSVLPEAKVAEEEMMLSVAKSETRVTTEEKEEKEAEHVIHPSTTTTTSAAYSLAKI